MKGRKRFGNHQIVEELLNFRKTERDYHRQMSIEWNFGK
jgi:hypothetical protein